jgi:hypothetical protein
MGGAAMSGGAMGFMKAIPIIGWILSGMMANANLYQQGWDVGGQTRDITRSTWATPAGLALNSIMFNDTIFRKLGLGGKWASILSGSSLVARAFGHKKPEARGGGVLGNLSLDGFEGEMYQDYLSKGGWFRSDKWETKKAPMNREMRLLINNTIGQVPKQMQELLEEFGQDFGDVFGDDWSKWVKIVLADKGNWDDIAERLAKETTRVYREMATVAVESIREGWGEFVADLKDLDPDEFGAEMQRILLSLRILDDIKGIQEKIFGVAGLALEDFEALADTGELIYETISRLADTFNLTNRLSRITGINFAGIGLDSAADRQALVDEAGGVDILASLLESYWDTFATEQERFDMAAESLRDAFDAIGATIPNSVEGFRALVAAQDMSTEAGRRMALQLMELAPAFSAIIGAIEQMSASMDNTIDNLRRSFELDGLSNQEKYNRLKKEADEAYIEFQQATDPAEIQRLFDLITTNMGQAWGLLSDDEKNARRAEYLNRLDALQESKDDRIGALIEQYTGVDIAEQNIAESGNKLAQAILDVAEQLGADISGITLKSLPDAIEFIEPLENLTKPLLLGIDEISNAVSALEDAYNGLRQETKPLLLGDDPDAAFIAAHQLIQEAAAQQGASAESFGDSVSSSAADFVQAVQSAAAMQQTAGSHSAAAMSAAAGSLYALASALQEQASASQQQTQKIRASELN